MITNQNRRSEANSALKTIIQMEEHQDTGQEDEEERRTRIELLSHRDRFDLMG